MPNIGNLNMHNFDNLFTTNDGRIGYVKNSHLIIGTLQPPSMGAPTDLTFPTGITLTELFSGSGK